MQTQPQPVAPPIREFDLRTVERLGREIARQDRAAWRATDAVRPSIPDPKAAGLLGWIVDPPAPGGGPDLVRFLRGDPAAPEALYDVRVPAAGAPQVIEPHDRKLSPDELAMWRARQTAVTHMGRPCRAGYNTAVARDPDGRDWLVWLLAPQPTAGAIPVGGHYRFTISADGETLKQRDALSASCLVVQGGGQGVPAGAKPQMAFTTHVVSATPVETHVFLQLQSGLPLYVATSKTKVWMINGGRISEAQLGATPPR